MSEEVADTKSKAKDEERRRREEAKQLAEARRVERKNRKRKCALCGVDESEKTPFVAHPDGIGPTCKEPGTCEHFRANKR